MLEFIPSFGGTLYTIAAFIVALSIIVAIHEYGHYIVGRWSGIHAEVFSIGFGPVLWSRVDKRGTKWQIAALPFGGYVKFLGDADAASGKDGEAIAQMDPELLRKTMHAAPLWARASTVAAGPVFNFIMSILIFAVVIGFRGTASEPLTIDQLLPMPVQHELREGDEILAIAGQPTPSLEAFDGFIADLPVAETLDYTVLRDGDELVVPGPYPYPPMAAGITPDSAAMDVGLESGDYFLSLEGQPLQAFSELRDAVAASEGATVGVEVWRDGETFEITLAPRRVDLPTAEGGFETRWLIGIGGGLFFEPATESPGIGTSLAYGVDQTVYIVRASLSGLYHMVSGAISSCNLRGPIGIAQTSGAAASQGVVSFIWFVAVLSTAVGLLNLFPIPVLDGGHLVFHAYEAVAGRPPSDRALQVMMGVGFALLMTLMVFALGNDLFCP